jgi:glycosyltransferase involved in cell wall biosynthesis
LLCNPGDAEDLYQSLSRLRVSPALRHKLAAAARRTVRERFTWRHAAERTLDVVQSVLSGTRQVNTEIGEPKGPGAVETVR